MKNLVICGAGGHGSEMLELVRTLNSLVPRWNILGFIDDDEKKIGTEKDGTMIIGNNNFFGTISEPTDIVFGFASTRGKDILYNKLKENSFLSFPSIIHPSALVADSAVIGEGTVITAMCFVSTNVTIGKCVCVSVASQVAHDSIIEDFCSIMPSVNICGNVKIGTRSFIGVRTAIHQGISIGSDCLVGMGSVVIRDVKDGKKVFGNPATEAP